MHGPGCDSNLSYELITFDTGAENNNDNIGKLANRVRKADDEVWLSVENLQRLNCISPTLATTPRRVLITRYGRALIRAHSSGDGNNGSSPCGDSDVQID
jgi:hypothetical protein